MTIHSGYINTQYCGGIFLQKTFSENRNILSNDIHSNKLCLCFSVISDENPKNAASKKRQTPPAHPPTAYHQLNENGNLPRVRGLRKSYIAIHKTGIWSNGSSCLSQILAHTYTHTHPVLIPGIHFRYELSDKTNCFYPYCV